MGASRRAFMAGLSRNAAAALAVGAALARPAVAAGVDRAAFAGALDRAPLRPVLKPETIRAMTTPSKANPGYARGWRVNRAGNWWHTGHLAGTTGLMVHAQNGFRWAALLNTRHRNDAIDQELEKLTWSIVARANG